MVAFKILMELSLSTQHKRAVQLFFKQLVIRPFSADFDLRDRPPVYKTAALPIELRRRAPEVSSSPKTTVNLLATLSASQDQVAGIVAT